MTDKDDSPKHDHGNHNGHNGPEGQNNGHEGHQDHHAMMVADFRKRFWISLVLTLPMLALSPMLGRVFGYGEALSFSGDMYVLLALGAAVYIYGGKPFTTGMYDELKKKEPGMMTLIGLAVSVAFFYSVTVVLGLNGRVFFWEPVRS